MKKRVLVTGAKGLVGSRFCELSNFELIATDREELDISSKISISKYLSKVNPNVLVNFAAYTNVDLAESERGNEKGDVWKLNVSGPQNLADECEGKGVHLIHISTDMVFPGDAADKGPYQEAHKISLPVDRLTWYGYTKGMGEREVLLRENSAVVRIIYPVRASFRDKTDYIRKIIQLYDTDKLYPLFGDQQISICFIDDLATMIDKIIEKRLTGIFHCSSKDVATPVEIAKYALQSTRQAGNLVKQIDIRTFIEKTGRPIYRYPKYGGLKVDRSCEVLSIKPKTWKQIIDILVDQGMGADGNL